MGVKSFKESGLPPSQTLIAAFNIAMRHDEGRDTGPGNDGVVLAKSLFSSGISTDPDILAAAIVQHLHFPPLKDLKDFGDTNPEDRGAIWAMFTPQEIAGKMLAPRTCAIYADLQDGAKSAEAKTILVAALCDGLEQDISRYKYYSKADFRGEIARAGHIRDHFSDFAENHEAALRLIKNPPSIAAADKLVEKLSALTTEATPIIALGKQVFSEDTSQTPPRNQRDVPVRNPFSRIL